jgi:hypothetical protein
MTPTCERTQRALVAGEPLAGELARHAETCRDCAAVAGTALRLRTVLGRTAVALPADAGLVARVSAGAERRLARRGWRVAALSGAVATAAALVLWLGGAARAREVLPAAEMASAMMRAIDGLRVPPEDAVPVEPEDVMQLVLLSDVDMGLGLSARWDLIEEPIDEYRELAPGAMPDLGPRPRSIR